MKTQCPNCKSKFNVSEANIGKQAKCPKCTNPFKIEPFIEPPPPAAAAAKISAPTAPAVQNPVQQQPQQQPTQPVKTAEAVPEKITEPAKTNQPKSKVLSKILYVYCWAALRVIAGIFAVLGLRLIIKNSADSVLMAIFAVANIFMIGSIVIEMMLFYKMWAVIQEGSTSVTPAKAVGFLFIPVFNLYWALLMLTGFPEDYNSFIKRRSVQAKELPLVLFMIYAFVFIVFEMAAAVLMISVFMLIDIIGRAFKSYADLAWIMFFFMAAVGICHFITHILIAAKTCNAINALSQEQSRQV